MTDTRYSDNVLVGRRANSGSFLAVRFDPEADAPVCLYRYVVPGRTDTYSFDWVPGSPGVGARVRYFSDESLPLSEALAKIMRDLDKQAVVELLVQACRNRETYLAARVLVNELLPVLAPKSKALRACEACMEEFREEMRKRIARLRKEQQERKESRGP